MAMSLWPHFFGPSCMFRTQSFALNPYYCNYAEIIFWLVRNALRLTWTQQLPRSKWRRRLAVMMAYAYIGNRNSSSLRGFETDYWSLRLEIRYRWNRYWVWTCNRRSCRMRPTGNISAWLGGGKGIRHREILPFISTGYLHASCCKSMQIIKKPSLRKRPRASVCRSLLCFKTVNFTRCLRFTTGCTMKVCRKL